MERPRSSHFAEKLVTTSNICSIPTSLLHSSIKSSNSLTSSVASSPPSTRRDTGCPNKSGLHCHRLMSKLVLSDEEREGWERGSERNWAWEKSHSLPNTREYLQGDSEGLFGAVKRGLSRRSTYIHEYLQLPLCPRKLITVIWRRGDISTET